MRVRVFVALTLMAGLVDGQTPKTTTSTPPTPPVPQFGNDEKAKVLDYWGLPNRYVITTPSDAQTKGLWQVRLTVKGSTWLWNYNKARKLSAPPTENVQPVNPQQKDWETWIVAKLNRDRWEALQQAQAANQKLFGSLVPLPDKTFPASEPPVPGTIPDGLLALAGDPPKFASAVVPMEHDIAFDDITITYQDNIRVSNPRYPYYRFGRGVNSEGAAVKEMPADRLDHLFRLAGVSESEARIMRAVSFLEGGFDAVNTYDTGYVSVGFIQFASLKEGGGSLGAFMQDYKSHSPDDFQRDLRQYGIDISPTGVLDVLDLQTGAELTGPDAALQIIEDPRMTAVFQRAGLKSDPFIAAQIRSAKSQFFPADDVLKITSGGLVLSGKVSDIIKSEAGLATLMDRKVNTGKLDPLAAVLSDIATTSNVTSFSDLASHELEIIQKMKYRKNYLEDATLSQPVSSRNSRNKALKSRSGDRSSNSGGLR